MAAVFGLAALVLGATQLNAGAARALAKRDRDIKPVSITGRPARVVLYGDSLSAESRAAFQFAIQSTGRADVTTKTYGGTAICDWFPDMKSTIPKLHPDAVVLEFSGNSITPCMRDHVNGQLLSGKAWMAKYQQDLSTAIRLIKPSGARIYVVAAPVIRVPHSDSLAPMYESIVKRTPGAVFVDAGQAVLDHGHYTDTLPCLPFEGAGQGCLGGRIVVRAPDGAHFCPGGAAAFMGVTNPCKVWSSGAWRFGTAMAAPVIRDFSLTSRA
jgi:hypothetical protein